MSVPELLYEVDVYVNGVPLSERIPEEVFDRILAQHGDMCRQHGTPMFGTDQVRQMLEWSSHLFVLEDPHPNSNRILGFATVHHNKDDPSKPGMLDLEFLCTRPGQGYGRMIVDAVEEFARDTDHDTVHLDSLPTARGFYEHLGYTRNHDDVTEPTNEPFWEEVPATGPYEHEDWMQMTYSKNIELPCGEYVFWVGAFDELPAGVQAHIRVITDEMGVQELERFNSIIYQYQEADDQTLCAFALMQSVQPAGFPMLVIDHLYSRLSGFLELMQSIEEYAADADVQILAIPDNGAATQRRDLLTGVLGYESQFDERLQMDVLSKPPQPIEDND